MAQRTVVQLTDDLTDEEGDDISTVEFALDGVTYEIDLTEKNAGDLRDELQVYISAGRRVSGRAKRGTAVKVSTAKRDPQQTKAIREWAATNGYSVNPRGRIPSNIEQAYEQAHQGSHLAAV